MTEHLSLSAMGLVTPIGTGKAETAENLFKGSQAGFRTRGDLIPGRQALVGEVMGDTPALPAGLAKWDCRNNRMMAVALEQIRPDLDRAIGRYGANRIAVILGTSTSGIAEGEAAFAERVKAGRWPPHFDYAQQETGGLSEFVKAFLGLTGPAYTIATACSSSAKVFATARRLIRLGLVDAAIVGGADSLCRMTPSGFTALASVSARPANPFSRNRDGITIGEAAAVFLLEKEPGEIVFMGIGETSDAHHISAPDPQGAGAENAMRAALDDAGCEAGDIAYVNLHGTATPLNDAMEGRAVHAIFGAQTPCSSTKAMTGHTLGAAGACEAAFLWLTLSQEYNPSRLLPPQLWDGVRDEEIAPLHLTGAGECFPGQGRVAMLSNSFAFGGSNVAIILGRR
ncbi:beta-ketoacyl-ACP synthase [Bosea caraganae]|uniref:Beta-ketoacyl-ACP synthase n=1 Tax=Bosea caraganae TaxID=2763117 RepID=A0A370L842_9HYPH|nr:beta-ketoacyl-[acyl-carrier-protein] synthase family protein [Bosea caraganae]RDJ25224.1 beta-ketoacyl-ACP synthase [Bosea caraganae]RDJ26334.1 beta-ketoacyl-ACP synthase [Bosea caraganae]